MESMENLRENLAEQGQALEHLPQHFAAQQARFARFAAALGARRDVEPVPRLLAGHVGEGGLGLYEGSEISAAVLRAFESRLPDAMGSGLGGLDAIEGGLATALRDASPPPSAPLDAVISRLAPPSKPWSTMPPDSTIGDPSEGAAARRDRVTWRRARSAQRRRRGSGEPRAPVVAAARRPEAGRAGGCPGDRQRKDGPSAATRHLAQPGLSFVALWPAAEREAIAEIERDHRRGAVCRRARTRDALVADLRQAAELAGSSGAARDPATVPALLGLDEAPLPRLSRRGPRSARWRRDHRARRAQGLRVRHRGAARRKRDLTLVPRGGSTPAAPSQPIERGDAGVAAHRDAHEQRDRHHHRGHARSAVREQRQRRRRRPAERPRSCRG